MLAQLESLFFPHHSNNHKPRVLHNSSLSFFIGFIIFVQFSFNFVARAAPGVLGVSANITPEEIVRLTNIEREKSNLPPVQSDSLLIEAARQKAADMLTLDYWAHNSPTGKTPWWFFRNVGYQYGYAGENLARDFSISNGVVQAWMDSPTHRENITNKNYQDIGVAVVEGIFQGKETTLVVQMFGTKVPVVALPETAKGEKTVSEVLSYEGVKEQGYLGSLSDKIPLFNAFEITKIISLVLLLFLFSALAIDFFVISHKKIFRVSGKSLIHLLFLVIMAIALIFTQQGVIL